MKAKDLMNTSPRVVAPDSLAIEAVSLMEAHKITSLFVTAGDQRLLGLVRLHDLMTEKLL